MNVCVIGAGYVGLVTAACFAELGHEVVGVDHDPARIMLLNNGGVPIYEPGLEEMIQRNLAAGRLRFTTSTAEGVDAADVIFIAVGTPPKEDGSADIQHVVSVGKKIGQFMTRHKIVVNKSTVPVGTAALVEQAVMQGLEQRGVTGIANMGVTVVSNPEFLKEGAAIDDFMRPDRIVIGVPSTPQGTHAKHLLTQLYAPFNRHHERTIWMDVASAELTKYASNAMLATRISFMNEVARLADQVGADVDHIRRGMGADSRIGHGFLYAGAGYGGSCFPKDTQALVKTGAQHGVAMQLVQAVEQVYTQQKQILFDRIVALYGPHLKGLTIAIWGLAFKPNTNDIREAPSLLLINRLLETGAQVKVYDPVAMPETQAYMQEYWGCGNPVLEQLQYVGKPIEAALDADALVLITEWKCFHNPHFSDVKMRMRHAIVLDGRNIYDPQQLQDLGIAYCGMGRRNDLGLKLMSNPHLPIKEWAEN